MEYELEWKVQLKTKCFVRTRHIHVYDNELSIDELCRKNDLELMLSLIYFCSHIL